MSGWVLEQVADKRAQVQAVESDADLLRSYAVMRQLRPHLGVAEFIERVRRQMAGGYRLVCLREEEGGDMVAVAGYRIAENLAWGRFLYVDDLVVDEARRATGFGRILMDHLVEAAWNAGCVQLHLDSGVQRFDAHRFYYGRGLHISGYHFVMELI